MDTPFRLRLVDGLKYLKISSDSCSDLNLSWVSKLTNLQSVTICYTNGKIIGAQEIIRSGVKKLKLECSNIDITSYEGLDELLILGLRCLKPEITDTMVNIKKLSIMGNPFLTDVNKFCNAEYLCFAGCHQVKDVSELGNVTYLDLSYCFVSDVSNLHNVKYLNLDRCYNVTDVSNLENIVELNLSHCCEITSIKGLTNLKKLNITNCTRLQADSLLDLNSLEDLITNSDSLTGFEHLKELTRCNYL